jgi:hypothetical protein
MNNLTQQRLKEKLHYDPNSGIFTYHVNNKTRKVYFTVGNLTDNGYIRISVDNKLYYAHRLAWLYVHGQYPKDQIDHLDGNRINNRINNLRLATSQINAQNPKCEYRGYNKHGTKWRVRICVNNELIYIGSYDTEEEASIAYINARKIYHVGYIDK